MGKRRVRGAVESDRQFVSDLMEGALSPYYDGNHRAHANRIFTTHINGGEDHRGHFSSEQKMFILEEDERPIGMINIVRKKQGTWKISPLIIDPSRRGTGGCGTELLTYAENYAKERGVRQMYCTVAQQNHAAFGFFRKKGYICAGQASSHYKPGITERMMYKIFFTPEEVEHFDRVSISVLPMTDEHKPEVEALIIEKLSHHFNGVDASWVQALFDGYDRRNSGEVNDKYKLIYVATDRSGKVIGVAGATPKKGEPIKIMPCVAYTAQAFAALIADIPQHLREYGRKLYIHLVPSVEETIMLQRLGWSIEAIMPAAYNDNYCTQQWGIDLGSTYMRTMRVKANFHRLIMSGVKPLEVRVGYGNIKSIRVGEKIRLMSRSLDGVIRVLGVRRYDTFAEMLKHEDGGKIVPGMDDRQVLQLLQDIYPPHKERLGVYVIEVDPVKN
ncbi:MAG: GCN5-related N-acetyltransferase [Candidatus Magasanikbacteria bacterium GW2011_GWA2_56_11]|uniref:GCN5-related N-acetyltransferase n=1 Tax=Candidatus Magasanikbacteria bacterium GW2011_GWA2_56_11 TaxID=1619044 RepID=A0A0G1YIJ2_9BACT|nr:MAG: GCN5-related N-acetyltransferase [Candidatus Magasanikbacteria bacterium GW2011_GWA2_56_11]